MTPLKPAAVAQMAQSVYKLKDMTVSEFHAFIPEDEKDPKEEKDSKKKNLLGCEDDFEVSDSSRFSGTAGGFGFQHLSGFGYICRGKGPRKGEILVVTRGTNDKYDMITDARAAFVPWRGVGMVHNGFSRLFHSYCKILDKFVKDNVATHVHCVGHSLGGALATLNASYLATWHSIPTSLYTFGCPRVGDLTFGSFLTCKLRPKNIYRVVHSSDPAPMVPCFPYLHVPTLGGKNYTIPKNGFIDVSAHEMERYKTSVESFDNWDALATAATDMAYNESAAKAVMDLLKQEGGKVIIPFSSASWKLLQIALTWLLKRAFEIAGTVVGVSLTAAFSTLDLFALLLGTAATLCAKMARYVIIVLNALTKFMGEAILWTGKMAAQAAEALGEAAVSAANAAADAAIAAGEAVTGAATSLVDSLNALIHWVFEKLNRKINSFADSAFRRSNEEQESHP